VIGGVKLMLDNVEQVMGISRDVPKLVLAGRIPSGLVRLRIFNSYLFKMQKQKEDR
jgi:hypothetical protein